MKSGWLGGWIAKKMNPDVAVGDVGEEMAAYYDEDKKCWVFPGEDPVEAAKPPPPPPTGGMGGMGMGMAGSQSFQAQLRHRHQHQQLHRDPLPPKPHPPQWAPRQ